MTQVPRGQHLERVRAALNAAGTAGLTAAELAGAVGVSPALMQVLLCNYRTKNHVLSIGCRPLMRWLSPTAGRDAAIEQIRALMHSAQLTPADVFPDLAPARSKAKAPKPKREPKPVHLPKLKRAALPGSMLVHPSAPSFEPPRVAPGRPDPRAEAIIPPHVQIQRVPLRQDTRYLVDPAHEGELMQDWRRRLAGDRS